MGHEQDQERSSRGDDRTIRKGTYGSDYYVPLMGGADHVRVSEKTGAAIYFARPYATWQ